MTTTSGTTGTSTTGETEECSLWAQDCPDSEKCMPYSDNGGSVWNALKCSPIDPTPQQPSAVCTTEGGGLSGVDNCAKGSMCWEVDSETNEGICVAFCEGTSAEDATCDPGLICTIPADGILLLCHPTCDPLLQDCLRDSLAVKRFKLGISARRRVLGRSWRLKR